MRPIWKRRWVSALRSGAYKQYRSGLRCRGAHCPLGVLAELVNPKGWFVKPGFEGDGWRPPNSKSKGDVCVLEGKFITDRLQLSLGDQSQIIVMNDKQGLTFEQIASWIEVNL